MTEISDIINFIKSKSGANDVLENSDINLDLGIDGDDFADLINEFSKKYRVDISSFLWYFHFAEEGSWNTIRSMCSQSPNNRFPHIAVTPLVLLEAAKPGKWNLEYPQDELF